ncbi:MAG: FlgB family protein [Alphaproteobacteria bacterium]|nr:MAG: FlgB family protein [Alphaproteobacteria bacterium]
MTLDLAILRLSEHLAAYAATRQGVIAENIANADTPGYKARDLLPFAEAYAEMALQPMAATATRPGHFALPAREGGPEIVFSHGPGTLSPNGNDVGLEDQMLRAAQTRMQHDLALGVYAKTLAILRTGLGRAR